MEREKEGGGRREGTGTCILSKKLTLINTSMKGRRKEEEEEDVHVSIEKVVGTYKNWLCLHKIV